MQLKLLHFFVVQERTTLVSMTLPRLLFFPKLCFWRTNNDVYWAGGYLRCAYTFDSLNRLLLTSAKHIDDQWSQRCFSHYLRQHAMKLTNSNPVFILYDHTTVRAIDMTMGSGIRHIIVLDCRNWNASQLSLTPADDLYLHGQHLLIILFQPVLSKECFVGGGLMQLILGEELHKK